MRSSASKRLKSTDSRAPRRMKEDLRDYLQRKRQDDKITSNSQPKTPFSVELDAFEALKRFSTPRFQIYVSSGRFLMWLAKRNLDSKNYLGLEIRKKLVKRAEHWVNELALRNIHFLFANAMVSFKQLISTYPGPLMLVSILCPDPHFKKKYHKRRVLQKPLVESIVDSLMPGGQVNYVCVSLPCQKAFPVANITSEDILLG
ncbi:hypothetical protein ACSBR1_004511 [Camellia fascicularis]